MYALIGMALGYFSYRYNLPLTIRSALYPIFGNKIDGPIGHSRYSRRHWDNFGIATTCGIGVVQLNYGLHVLFDYLRISGCRCTDCSCSGISIISVTSGVNKGLRILSEINIYVSIGLYCLFCSSAIPSFYSMRWYKILVIINFPTLALQSFAFEQPKDWMSSWTLFFWAWWIAWSPFVGLFWPVFLEAVLFVSLCADFNYSSIIYLNVVIHFW
jgi:choline/glycine/proline betaine transport protein